MVYTATVPVYRMYATAYVLISKVLAQDGCGQYDLEAVHCFCMHLAGLYKLTRTHVSDDVDGDDDDNVNLRACGRWLGISPASILSCADVSKTSPSLEYEGQAYVDHRILLFSVSALHTVWMLLGLAYCLLRRCN